MDFTTLRVNMLNSQIMTNRVTDPRVRAAMMAIPREVFLPPSRQPFAYLDEDILISQQDEDAPARYLMEPMSFARMVQVAELSETDVVLDVGCGIGYSAAILGQLAGSVLALESHAELADSAADRLAALECDAVVVVKGPLKDGYRDEGPYDAIFLEGAVDYIPEELFQQLAEKGRLVAIVKEGGVSRVWRYVKTGSCISRQPFFEAWVHPLPGFQKDAEFVF